MSSVSRDEQSFNETISSAPRDMSLSLFFPPSLSLSLSFSIALVLSLRPLLSLVARVAATLNDSATRYEKNVPHIRKEIKVLRLHFSTLALVSVFPFLSFARISFVCRII